MCRLFAVDEEAAAAAPAIAPTVAATVAPANVTASVASNGTTTLNTMTDMATRNWPAVVRSTYVFGALCLLAIIYFGIRTWRLGRRRGGARRTGTRKYQPLQRGGGGAASASGSSTSERLLSHEMEPLGAGADLNDEDEDTLFETSSSSSPAIRH